MLLATTLLLLLGVFTSPNNHDESQYVAGAALARTGLIYRDFASLQPPLQSWVYAPLASLFPGWTLLAMRLATALFSLAAAAATYGAQRTIGIDRRAASLATLAMACTATFLFTGSVVRNDALPAALAAGATAAALHGALRQRLRAMALAGLLLGAATSAKLSYAPMLACAGVAPLLYGRWRGLCAVLAFAVGAAIGLLPMLLAALPAPQAFLYGVFTYARTAPFEWYVASGRGGELGIGVKILFLLLNMLQGPALLAAILSARTLIGRRHRLRPQHVMLAALLAGGALGAVLPTPTQIQYLLPMLPPLFVAFGLAIARGALASRGAAALAILFALAGIAPSIADAAKIARKGRTVLAIERQAHAIGAFLAQSGAEGVIASVAPERVIDSGYPIDPRFAAGPFLFRNGGLMPPALVRALKAVTPQTLEESFGQAPPAAILVGYEKLARNGGPPADAPLEAYAVRHDFQRADLTDGLGRLYVRPVAGPKGR